VMGALSVMGVYTLVANRKMTERGVHDK
jgi:hypothetical protein